MKSTDSNTILVNSYFRLLQNLSLSGKADLISKLSQSLKVTRKDNLSDFEKAFGSWEGDDTAEEMIDLIKKSRNFNRQLEEL